jgi:hypothetical protein
MVHLRSVRSEPGDNPEDPDPWAWTEGPHRRHTLLDLAAPLPPASTERLSEVGAGAAKSPRCGSKRGAAGQDDLTTTTTTQRRRDSDERAPPAAARRVSFHSSPGLASVRRYPLSQLENDLKLDRVRSIKAAIAAARRAGSAPLAISERAIVLTPLVCRRPV